MDPAYADALSARVNDPRRFAAFVVGATSYIRLAEPCARCGGFRRRVRDRSCYTCHLNRGKENFERMKAGLSPNKKRSLDSHLDLLERQKREREGEFLERVFGSITVRLFPTGRLQVTYPDGYVEQDLNKVSPQGVARLVELLPELRAFRPEFLRLRELFNEGKVGLEGEWAIDEDWNPTAWNSSNCWGRIKLDAFVHLTKHHGVVIDYKTGRKNGNEIKHAEQCQLYQLAAFMRYPDLEVIDVELWYTDQDEITHMRYTRDQGLRFFQKFHNQAVRMTTETEFPANPNIFSCKWCPYGPRGTGHCTKGV
jgi:hypothetical protein